MKGGEKHPDVSSSLMNIGTIYLETGKVEEGTKYIEKALKLILELYGEPHITLGKIYTNLGNAYRLMGDPAKGIYYFKKGLENNIQLFGMIILKAL